MHFVILVEDQSGKVALDILIPKIIGIEDQSKNIALDILAPEIIDNKPTFEVKSYKGVGRIPSKMNKTVDPSKRILLDNLPRLLAGYGKTWQQGYEAVVIVVCDLDDKCLKSFRDELIALLNTCNPPPETRFCIAIEEGEAWFLGDISAIKQAYPQAKTVVLKAYSNDSICGTWEKLADAVYRGGSQNLASQGWQAVGKEKSLWAENITPYMDINNNASASFNYFVKKLQELI